MSEEVVRALVADGDIDVVQEGEVCLDVEAVLKEFIRRDREVTDVAKQQMESQGLGYGNLGKIKAKIAKNYGFPPPDESLPYILEQVLEMLFHSNNVDEIYADDLALRKKLTPVLRKHMEVDEGLDEEVRARIKNLEEGTAAFEIEYERLMGDTKRKHQLDS